MKFRRSSALFVLAVIVIAGAWYAVTRYEAARARSEELAFPEVLQSSNIDERVVVGGTAYDVEGETVSNATSGAAVAGAAASLAQRLAYAKAAAERSPLMALPNIDLTALNTYIGQLSDAQVALAGIQSTSSDATLVRTSLYPISFLKAEEAAEAARRTFIESGSDTDEAAYEKAQLNAVSAYQSDISAFRSAFEQIIPTDTGEYADATYVVTRAGILKELQSLASGNEQVAAELRARDACIAGTSNECDPSALQFATTTVPVPQQVTPAQEELTSEIYSIWRKPGPLYPSQEIDLSSSACTDGLGAANRFLLIFKANEMPEIMYLYLGDIRFVKASDASETAFGTYLQSEGISYVFDSPLTHYTCLALNDDLADLFSVWDITQFSRTTPVSAYTTGTQAKQLQTLETTLSSTKLVNESDAVAYLVDAMQASSSAPSAVSDELGSLYLERLDGDAGLTYFIHSIAWTESTNVELYDENVPITLSAEYLFYIRSGFLGLFMSNNPSVVGQQGQPFPLDTTPISQQPYVLYSQLDAAQQAKAVSDLHAFTTLHNDAAEEDF